MQPPQYPYQQPGQFGPPPKRPGRLSRFVSWYREQSRTRQIIVGLVILALAIFVLSAVVVGAVQGVQQGLHPTPTTQVSQPTPAPTSLPKPAATLTVVQRIDQIINANATNDSKVDVTDNDGKTVNAIITLSSAPDHTRYQAWIKQNCFAILKAVWTAKITGLKDVNLAFRGVSFTGPIGRCEVTASTSAKDPWSSLDPDTAWDAAYDVAMFYPAIS